MFLRSTNMAASTTISYTPSKFLGSNLVRQRRLSGSSIVDSFSSSRSKFCGRFRLGRDISGRNSFWVPIIMDKSARTSAFRDGNSEEVVNVFEQEAFIDRPSELRSKFGYQRLEARLNKVSKWIVASLFSSILLWRHDAGALWFAAGSILNAMLALALKQILDQERPSALKSDPGMPSSHAQSIFFTVVFTILSSVEWLGLNEVTIIISALALAIGSYFTYLRVSQQLHTVSQVVVGATIGSIFSLSWYWSWNTFMQDAFASSLWVRILVVLGGFGFCLGFLAHVVRHWLKEE